MKHLKTYFLISLLFCSCVKAQVKLNIIPIKCLNLIDTSKKHNTILSINKYDYYLIKNYRDNIQTLRYIKNFVKKNKDNTLSKYDHYHIIFYRESNETNLEKINHYVKNKDKYFQNVDDLVYDFDWDNGKFLAVFKYKNGKIVNPHSKILIKNIDIPADSL